MVSIEAFVLVNLLMNLLVITASARGLGHIRWGRMLAAALFATGYALAAYAGAASWLKSTAGVLLSFTVMSAIAFAGSRHCRRGCLRLTGYIFFAGGIQLMMKQWLPGSAGVLIGGCAVLIACGINDRLLRNIQSEKQYRIRIRIRTRMGEAEMDALVDSGNRLTEPLSGLPVIIAGRNMLAEILDRNCLYPQGKYPPVGFRKVRYGTLGGDGVVDCFRPESVCVENGGTWMEGEDVWVAIYPGRLPSGIGALAPPELIGGRKRNRKNAVCGYSLTADEKLGGGPETGQ